MKSTYSKPTLVEYGSMASLTQGTGLISNDLLNGNAVPGTGCFVAPTGSTVCDDTRLIVSS
jgi:hypothetical protein